MHKGHIVFMFSATTIGTRTSRDNVTLLQCCSNIRFTANRWSSAGVVIQISSDAQTGSALQHNKSSYSKCAQNDWTQVWWRAQTEGETNDECKDSRKEGRYWSVGADGAQASDSPGPDLNHEFTAPLSITLFYDSNEIYSMFIFFSSYEMLQTIYVVRKVKLSHSWGELVTIGGDLNQKSPNVAPTAVSTMLGTPTHSTHTLQFLISNQQLCCGICFSLLKDIE